MGLEVRGEQFRPEAPAEALRDSIRCESSGTKLSLHATPFKPAGIIYLAVEEEARCVACAPFFSADTEGCNQLSSDAVAFQPTAVGEVGRCNDTDEREAACTQLSADTPAFRPVTSVDSEGIHQEWPRVLKQSETEILTSGTTFPVGGAPFHLCKIDQEEELNATRARLRRDAVPFQPISTLSHLQENVEKTHVAGISTQNVPCQATSIREAGRPNDTDQRETRCAQLSADAPAFRPAAVGEVGPCGDTEEREARCTQLSADAPAFRPVAADEVGRLSDLEERATRRNQVSSNAAAFQPTAVGEVGRCRDTEEREARCTELSADAPAFRPAAADEVGRLSDPEERATRRNQVSSNAAAFQPTAVGEVGRCGDTEEREARCTELSADALAFQPAVACEVGLSSNQEKRKTRCSADVSCSQLSSDAPAFQTTAAGEVGRPDKTEDLETTRTQLSADAAVFQPTGAGEVGPPSDQEDWEARYTQLSADAAVFQPTGAGEIVWPTDAEKRATKCSAEAPCTQLSFDAPAFQTTAAGEVGRPSHQDELEARCTQLSADAPVFQQAATGEVGPPSDQEDWEARCTQLSTDAPAFQPTASVEFGKVRTEGGARLSINGASFQTQGIHQEWPRVLKQSETGILTSGPKFPVGAAPFHPCKIDQEEELNATRARLRRDAVPFQPISTLSPLQENVEKTHVAGISTHNVPCQATSIREAGRPNGTDQRETRCAQLSADARAFRPAAVCEVGPCGDTEEREARCTQLSADAPAFRPAAADEVGRLSDPEERATRRNQVSSNAAAFQPTAVGEVGRCGDTEEREARCTELSADALAFQPAVACEVGLSSNQEKRKTRCSADVPCSQLSSDAPAFQTTAAGEVGPPSQQEDWEARYTQLSADAAAFQPATASEVGRPTVQEEPGARCTQLSADASEFQPAASGKIVLPSDTQKRAIRCNQLSANAPAFQPTASVEFGKVRTEGGARLSINGASFQTQGIHQEWPRVLKQSETGILTSGPKFPVGAAPFHPYKIDQEEELNATRARLRRDAVPFQPTANTRVTPSEKKAETAHGARFASLDLPAQPTATSEAGLATRYPHSSVVSIQRVGCTGSPRDDRATRVPRFSAQSTIPAAAAGAWLCGTEGGGLCPPAPAEPREKLAAAPRQPTVCQSGEVPEMETCVWFPSHYSVWMSEGEALSGATGLGFWLRCASSFLRDLRVVRWATFRESGSGDRPAVFVRCHWQSTTEPPFGNNTRQ